jgi:hypothetical protein
MKTYKLIKPDDYEGLFKVSLVEDPAIQSNLMYFSDEKEFLFTDEEQKIIYAPALIPNKLIPRRNINGAPANVYFDAETIRGLHIDGMRKGYDNKVNLNHEKEDTEGVFCFEQWIIEDAVNDKSVKLGFELPIGTLIKGYKIDNAQVWEDIKSGKLKGLSIEGQLFPDEQMKVNFKKEDMNKKSLWAMAVEKFKETFKFADMTDYGGGYFGTSLDMGAIISDAEGNPMESASFEYEGNKYTTDDMGAIIEIEPVEAGGAEDGDEKDAKITELETKIADLEAELAKVNEVQMSNEAADVKLKEDFEALKLSKETLDADNLKLQNELLELKRIPTIAIEEKADTPLEKYRKKKEMLK